MKLDKKSKWSLVAGCGLFVVASIWMLGFLILPKNTKTSAKFQHLKREKAKHDTEWMRYQKLRDTITELGRGWKRPLDKPGAKAIVNAAIPIKDAVDKQITEIERIHEEEIVGKLSNINRIYEEYRQNLLRDLEVQYSEKSKKAKLKLEADLSDKKKRQAKDLLFFRNELERKNQLTLINLELQKKMLLFNSVPNHKVQSETERIDSEIAKIRNGLKQKIANYEMEQGKKFELYQKRKTAEYHTELSELRIEKQRLIQTELNRFREEQMDEFHAWTIQRQVEVEKAIELRRFQQ